MKGLYPLAFRPADRTGRVARAARPHPSAGCLVRQAAWGPGARLEMGRIPGCLVTHIARQLLSKTLWKYLALCASGDVACPLPCVAELFAGCLGVLIAKAGKKERRQVERGVLWPTGMTK